MPAVGPAPVLAASLQAAGFPNAKQLVHKLQQLCTLGLEHLPSLAASQLAHCLAGTGQYTDSIRSSKPVLLVEGTPAPPAVDLRPVAQLLAEALRQRNSGAGLAVPETQLLAAAMHQAVVPLLSQQDRAAWEDMLAQALAPEEALQDEQEAAALLAQQDQEEEEEAVHRALLISCNRLGLQPADALLTKAAQLHKALAASGRSSVLLLGPACSGKSAAVRLVAAAAGAQLTWLYPDALTPEQLLGGAGPAEHGHCWQDGILAAACRRAIEEHCGSGGGSQAEQRQHWIVLQGQLDAGWAQELQQLLAAEGAALQLPDGELLALPPSARLILEVTAPLHPAAGSAAGQLASGFSSSICFQPDVLSWHALLEAWEAALPLQLVPGAELKQQLLALCHLLLPPCLAAAPGCCGSSPAPAPPQLALNFLRLLQALLQAGAAAFPAPAAAGESQSQRGVAAWLSSRPAADQPALLQAAVMIALAWGLGAHLDAPGRRELDAKLQAALAQAAAGHLRSCEPPAGSTVASGPFQLLVPLPEGSCIFDLLFDPAAMKWVPWQAAGGSFAASSSGSKAGGAAGASRYPLVPTAQRSAVPWIVHVLHQAGVPVALVGPAGCGKSALLQQLLAQRRAGGSAAVACYSHGCGRSGEALQQVVMTSMSQQGSGAGPLTVIADALQLGSEVGALVILHSGMLGMPAA